MYPMTNRWGEQVPKEKTEIKQEHNPEAIKQIQEYNKQLAWFLDNYEEIETSYAGLYVGIQDKEVKAAKETIEEVKEEVDTDRVYLLKYIPLDYNPRALGKKLANTGLEEYSERLKKIDNGEVM